MANIFVPVIRDPDPPLPPFLYRMAELLKNREAQLQHNMQPAMLIWAAYNESNCKYLIFEKFEFDLLVKHVYI